MRGENEKLRQLQGFVNSSGLVKDFESRKAEIKELEERLNELKKQHAFLMQQKKARSGAKAASGGTRARRS